MQPLPEVETHDPRAARVLAVLREVPPSAHAAPPGTALQPRRAPARETSGGDLWLAGTDDTEG